VQGLLRDISIYKVCRIFLVILGVPYEHFETSIMTYIRLVSSQAENLCDQFVDLRCYEGFKYAFLMMRNFNPKKEDISEYSGYLMNCLERCLQKVRNQLEITKGWE
jgi:hypothetical protein